MVRLCLILFTVALNLFLNRSSTRFKIQKVQDEIQDEKLFPPCLMYLSKCIYIQPLLKNHTYHTTVHLAFVNSLF